MNLLADASWLHAAVPPGSAATPRDLPGDLDWQPIEVPGTVGQVHGRDIRGTDIDEYDWWFVTEVARAGDGPWHLSFGGLATVTQVWAGDTMVAESESMFVPVAATLDDLPATVRIAIRFSSLAARGRVRRPRGRWRSNLAPAYLRWERTSLIGRAAFLSALPAPIGPWRPVRLTDTAAPELGGHTIRAHLRGEDGVVGVRARWRVPRGFSPPGERAGEVTLRVAGTECVVPLARTAEGEFGVNAEVVVPDVSLWWPHTHGTPHTYRVSATIGDREFDLGVAGFRTVAIDRSGGGFRVLVNGVEVFCRGACWVPVDPVGFSGGPELRRTLDRVARAGLNMLRVTGTMVYESQEFWDQCAELGILVWQDVMLATLDPPEDPAFLALLEAEVVALLDQAGANPALAVLCGGSETEQQAAFLGLGAVRIAAIHDVVPAVLERSHPNEQLSYVTSTPWSDPESGLPATQPCCGVTHYFGVGAYQRPLSDLRSAQVKFAAECLAFAIPPSAEMVDRYFGGPQGAGHHPEWKSRVPRDHRASWDFEDVWDWYVRELFGVDAAMVRRSDPGRYLELGRAACADAIARTIAYWRRGDSGCSGALILSLRDFEPGAGWGLLDSGGGAKAPWYPLARRCQPIAVLISDEGLNGIRVDIANDTGADIEGELVVEVFQRGASGPEVTTWALRVRARIGEVRWLNELLGRFTDPAGAYCFGPNVTDAVRVSLVIGGVEVARDVHLIGPGRPLVTSVGLSARVWERSGDAWQIEVSTEDTAEYVHFELDGWEPDDDWFHLPAGGRTIVAVRPVAGASVREPRGEVCALNALVASPVVLNLSIGGDS